nr:UvrD-helicase domain-containing protein [Acidimicrobiia bacterium]
MGEVLRLFDPDVEPEQERPEAAPVALLVDGDARDAIENDLDRNLFVEAGAGTGKTTALVRRIVRLFATGRLAEPSQLAAITFTEAAAAQLRDRIRAALERAAVDPAPPTAERDACRVAARRIDEAIVTTLHGFAQGLLAEHPLAARLPPVFEVDEGIPAELEFVERWAAFVDDLLADPDLTDDLEVGVTLGLWLPRLGEVARRFHDRWDRLVDVDLVDPGPVPPGDPAPVLDALRAAIGCIEERMAGSDDRLVRHLEETVAPLLARYDDAVATGDPLEVLRALAAEAPPAAANKGQKAYWGDQKAVVVAALETAKTAHAELLGGLRQRVLARLVPRLAQFTLAWADERRRAGRLHFHDLLVHARGLLWSDAQVRSVLARRFSVLLVDEFQDTDPLQVELVFALAADDPLVLPSRWDEIRLAPGKVLVVGDPKQSIYGFRGADITLWNRTRRRFGTDVVHLVQNFRSVGSILDWVNEVFDRLMGEGDGDAQPPYRSLDAHRVSLDDEPEVVLIGGPAPKGVRAAEVRLHEAADIAKVIAALKRSGRAVPDESAHAEEGATRPLRFDDVAILVPTRAPIGPVERALDEADIPYRVESRSLVWRTDVVRDVLSLLEAVEDPDDEVAVVAALRSPAFACTDVDLVDWRRAGGRFDPTRPWVEVDEEGTMPPELDGVAPGVAAALATLRSWHERRWRLTVDELVAGLLRELRLVPLTFAQRRPRDHWRRLRFVVDQARAFVEAGGTSLVRFLEWARLQTDEGAAAVEAIVPEPDDDAVRILTVHGSKGLEFPVVVLAGLATGAPPTITSVLWSGAGPEVAFSVLGGGAQFTTVGHDDAKAGAKQLEVAESRRLLYVAATRAREQLVVSVHHASAGGTGAHAQTLFDHCQDLAGRWRPAELEAEPPLLHVERAGPPARTAAEREAWRTRWDATI